WRDYEEGVLLGAGGAWSGSETEGSPAASRVGMLSAHLAGVVALVIPGVRPIVADGPLSAALGESAGHMAGYVALALEHAGLESGEAARWEKRIEGGAFLVGAHVDRPPVETARDILIRNGGSPVAVGTWTDT